MGELIEANFSSRSNDSNVKRKLKRVIPISYLSLIRSLRLKKYFIYKGRVKVILEIEYPEEFADLLLQDPEIEIRSLYLIADEIKFVGKKFTAKGYIINVREVQRKDSSVFLAVEVILNKLPTGIDKQIKIFEDEIDCYLFLVVQTRKFSKVKKL